MQRYNVDGLNFDFSDNWQVSQYDVWSFYRNQVSRMWSGIKALDLLAVDPNKTAWLIEVKDYRQQQRTKPSDLGDEVAHKVFDTLAALIPAKNCASDAGEKQIARAVTLAHSLRVVLHLEQPVKHSKLRPIAINPADVKQKIRQLLKPVDVHPLVVSKANLGALEWCVS
jgi:hypothetical protein